MFIALIVVGTSLAHYFFHTCLTGTEGGGEGSVGKMLGSSAGKLAAQV